MTKLLKVDDVAELTGWKPETVREKVRSGQLQAVRLGKSIRFDSRTIERLIAPSESAGGN